MEKSNQSVGGLIRDRSLKIRRIYKLLALLSVIFIATEIGSCSDETKNMPAGSSITLKDDSQSSVSINVINTKQSVDQKSKAASNAKVAKVVLDVNASKKTQPVAVTEENNKKSSVPERFQSYLIQPVQSSAIAKSTIVSVPYSQPAVPSAKIASQSPPQQKTEVKIQPQTTSSVAKSEIVAKTSSQPVSKPIVVAAVTSPPKQPQQPAAQPVSPPVAAGSVSLFANPPVMSAPSSQLAMAPIVHPVAVADSEVKKDKKAESVKPSPTPAPAQQSTGIPQPPSINGAAAPDIALPTTPSIPSDQKLGEAPRDTSLEFLRQQAVLLRPCEWQLDVGFAYLHSDNSFTAIDPDTLQLVEVNRRQRLLTVPMEFRYGLYQRVQLFANMPVGWANTETSYIESVTIHGDDFLNSGGIGDLNFGATIHLHESNGMSYSPDILATFGMTAPTGNGNALLSLVVAPNTTLGQGYWAGFWNVLAIHKYDPVVVFYGIGSRHYVAKDFDGFTGAKPGDQYTYQLGTGFAINERITFSTIFFGSYITEARLNDQVLEGTILEPMYLRFATTITRPNRRICEPFVEIGMTDTSANARAGITWTF